MDALGRVLEDAAKVGKGGIVIFLPSYKYEAVVVRRWKETGIWGRIKETKGTVWREPKESKDLETVLRAYERDATSKKGSVIMCVVGGKMSEGINFKDDMARVVLVAGLPYPDFTDPELREKMRYLDEEKKKTGGGGITGDKYYFNLCMRAVNQSIGRAIRHIGDWSAILLCDERYVTDKVWGGLPGWIREGGGRRNGTWDDVKKDMQAFFKDRMAKEGGKVIC